eukprot:TRINITY_DN38454_c0_g1_i1.p1 TRINITY_DN38454_c0_g1~~TRINITY_DN38454_c0_g1_i1.p1  ORF type:complete len:309 (+),score=35.32 TRINITY_DN38454_c0_g1_i1:86-1012(+)
MAPVLDGDKYLRLDAEDGRADESLEVVAPSTRSRASKVAAVAASCAALGLCAAGLYSSAEPSRNGVVVEMNTTALWAPEERDLSCWTNSGGTCWLFGCKASRGPTDCVSHQCRCKLGYCAAQDGSCYPAANTLIASGFTLRNVRWPDYQLYADGCAPRTQGQNIRYTGNLQVSNIDQGPAARWSLWRLPMTSTRDRPAYIMTPVSYPTCVATMDQITTCHPTTDSDGHSTQDCNTRTQGVEEMPWGGPDKASIRLTQVPMRNQYMIESVRWSNWFLYVPKFSWRLSSWRGDPDSNGHWEAEPPLPPLE